MAALILGDSVDDIVSKSKWVPFRLFTRSPTTNQGDGVLCLRLQIADFKGDGFFGFDGKAAAQFAEDHRLPFYFFIANDPEKTRIIF